MDEVVLRNVPATELKTDKNYCLYFFQVIACCLIIFLHARFPEYNVPVKFGFIMRAIARFGVPLFFIISGYFLYKEGLTKEETRAKLKKRMIHIGGLTLFSLTFYFIIFLFIHSFWEYGIGVGPYLKRTFTWITVVQFIFLNNSFDFFPHCWFLLAMLTSYLIIYLFPNLFMKKKWFVYVAASILVFMVIYRLLIGKYNPYLFGIRVGTEFIYRTWYANALPFMSLGIILKRNMATLVKIPKSITLIILIMSFPLMVLERWFAKAVCNADPAFLFMDIVCAANMVVFSMQHPTLFSKLKILNLKGSWIVYVYIFHPAIIKLVLGIFYFAGVEQTLVEWIYPVTVLILTVSLSILFSLIVNKVYTIVRTKRNKKIKEANN